MTRTEIISKLCDIVAAMEEIRLEEALDSTYLKKELLLASARIQSGLNYMQNANACSDCVNVKYPACNYGIPCCKCNEESCNSRQACPKKGSKQ